MRRRVVITGLGAVSPLGVGFAPLWEGLCAGKSGLGPITRFDASGFACKLGGEVKDFSAKDHVPKHYRKAVKVMARDTELAVAAAKFAVEDAGLITRASLGDDATGETTYPGTRTGCHIGAGLITAEAEELTSALATAVDPATGTFDIKAWGGVGLTNLQPLWMLKYLPNMLACHVTIIHGAEGPSNTITCADVSGILSIGESSRVIERDAADLCFAGGAESKLNLIGMLRLQFAGRIGDTGEETDGSRALMPYDGRSVGVPGEAGGILTLESETTAKARGAKQYAQIAGFAATHCGWPPYMTDQERVGSRGVLNRSLGYAIWRALNDAGIEPGDIDAIVPQAAGSGLEDGGEVGALRNVFGDRIKKVPLVTLTPNIGTCAAGSGGLMVAVAAKCLAEQKLPARLHAGKPDSTLMAGAAPSRRAALNYILVCSSSLGGQNGAIVLKAIE